MLTGLVAISALSYLLSQQFTPVTALTILYLYLLLAVSNAMFSSSEDLKGFIPFIVTLGIMAGAAYIAGFRIGITGPALSVTTQIFDALTKSLGIVLVLNVIGFILTKLLIALTEKLTRRKFLRRH
jgi:hypothetical protein